MSDALKWCREIDREPITDEITLGLVRIVRAAVSIDDEASVSTIPAKSITTQMTIPTILLRELRSALDNLGAIYRKELDDE